MSMSSCRRRSWPFSKQWYAVRYRRHQYLARKNRILFNLKYYSLEMDRWYSLILPTDVPNRWKQGTLYKIIFPTPADSAKSSKSLQSTEYFQTSYCRELGDVRASSASRKPFWERHWQILWNLIKHGLILCNVSALKDIGKLLCFSSTLMYFFWTKVRSKVVV